MLMRGLRIMVSGSFTALHSCVEGMPHQRTWHVTAWFRPVQRTDAHLYLATFDNVLAGWDGTTLPKLRDWNEDIVERLAELGDCVKVRLWHEAARLGAEWPKPCSTAFS
jgi:hypothetical protein